MRAEKRLDAKTSEQTPVVFVKDYSSVLVSKQVLIYFGTLATISPVTGGFATPDSSDTGGDMREFRDFGQDCQNRFQSQKTPFASCPCAKPSQDM
jgi:hypothetical protein